MFIYFVLALSFVIFVVVIAARLLLSLYALELGAQPLVVGTLAATFSVFPMLLSITAGKLGDRFGSRWPLQTGVAGMACAMLVPYFSPGLPALYMAAAVIGLSTTFFVVLLQNLIGTTSDSNSRTRNFSNFTLVGSAVNIVGPLFVGFSIDLSGHAAACLYLALLSLVPLTTLAIWGGALPGGSRKSAARAGNILGALPDPKVWKLLATSSFLVAGIDLFEIYIPIYGHSLGLSASAIGIVLGTYSAAGFLVRVLLTRLISWLSMEGVLVYAFVLGAASLTLIPFCTNVGVLAVLAFMFGLGMGCGQPITMMLTFSASAEGRSGEALGLRMTVNHLTRVVGPTVFGSIGSAFGLFPVFWISALLLAAGGMVSRVRKTH